ncbi:hypothetical protein Droror1_Dr00004626 [Drosera rotundifolia]
MNSLYGLRSQPGEFAGSLPAGDRRPPSLNSPTLLFTNATSPTPISRHRTNLNKNPSTTNIQPHPKNPRTLPQNPNPNPRPNHHQQLLLHKKLPPRLPHLPLCLPQSPPSRPSRLLLDRKAQHHCLESDHQGSRTKRIAPRRAMEMYASMGNEGVEADGYTYLYVISACPSSGSGLESGLIVEGGQIHGRVLGSGYGRNLFVGTSLVKFYGEQGGL